MVSKANNLGYAGYFFLLALLKKLDSNYFYCYSYTTIEKLLFLAKREAVTDSTTFFKECNSYRSDLVERLPDVGDPGVGLRERTLLF